MDWVRPIDTPTMVPTIRISSQSGSAGFGGSVAGLALSMFLRLFGYRRAAPQDDVPGTAMTMHVSEPWAMRVPASSHTRPSAVAMRPPAWMILPSHLSLPVFSNTGSHEIDGHVDRRVGLPGLQHRVHGASHRRIEQGGNPAAVHRAQRIVEARRRRGLEHDPAALDLDDPDIGLHRERRRRLRAVPEALRNLAPPPRLRPLWERRRPRRPDAMCSLLSSFAWRRFSLFPAYAGMWPA